ncbi:uncharacterized protein LOC130138912 [Syzygium oleosum]|uniref:uncharacterized protein LOC130138912 n=1 Tax=Syzygium oleosum TaxID=219896 RepID=UPI0024BB85A0|nr:uncharacterized protein LOC130138912 [Syzygium oleosum]
MLDHTAELVAQAASNSLVVFCFCNLLIVIILMAPKPSSNFEDSSEFHLPILTHNSVINKQRIDIEQPPKIEETSPEVMELCVSENLEKVGRSYNNEREDDGESNNDNDDALRRRIEAFIDKVNGEWKAEKLRTDYLCEQVDL